MATPQRPGWYTAPDGSATEQWWNGAAWSDTKRGVGGAAMPGLPAYRAAPPSMAPGSEPLPPLPSTQPPNPYPTLAGQVGGTRSVNMTNSSPTIALVFGILGIFILAPLGIVGIGLGIRALRKPGTVGVQRSLAIGGIVSGIVGLVWGAIQLAFVIFAFLSSAEYAT